MSKFFGVTDEDMEHASLEVKTAPLPISVPMDGWIFKKPVNQSKFRIKNSWAKRYADLNGRVLHWASSKEDLQEQNKIKGTLILRRGMSVTEGTEPFTFVVKDPIGESLFLAKSESAEGQQQWLECIGNEILLSPI